MRHNDQETTELTRDVMELSRELAALKRQHAQLRAAAERAADIASGIGCSDTNPEVLAEGILTGLNAALDATQAENALSKQALDPKL